MRTSASSVPGHGIRTEVVPPGLTAWRSPLPGPGDWAAPDPDSGKARLPRKCSPWWLRSQLCSLQPWCRVPICREVRQGSRVRMAGGGLACVTGFLFFQRRGGSAVNDLLPGPSRSPCAPVWLRVWERKHGVTAGVAVLQPLRVRRGLPSGWPPFVRVQWHRKLENCWPQTLLRQMLHC